MNVDSYLFQQINQFAGKSVCLDGLAIFFARYFEYFLILALLLFLVKNPAPEQSSVLDQSRTETKFLVRGLKKYWPMMVQAFSAAILSRFVLTNIIRWIWFRPRPFVQNHINLLFSYNPAEPSFPSGHAAFYFAIATVVFLYLKKVYPRPKFWWGAGTLFFVASFLISISRVFSGIHWPSDILAGALVGIFSGWLINKIFKKFQK